MPRPSILLLFVVESLGCPDEIFLLLLLYSTSQELSFDSHIDGVINIKYKIRQFAAAAILNLHFYTVLYSTSLDLSFDTHDKGVAKEYKVGHFVARAILDL
jgi:hypothetical protein